MPLSDIINLSITSVTGALQAAGFGVALVLGAHQHNSDLVRYYTDTAGMVTDGFAVTEPEYLAVQAIFSQSPRPPKVAVGRRQLRPTQHATITPTAQNSTLYWVKVNDLQASYTSDATATVAEITAGLKTAIDALAQAITVTDTGTALTVVANVVGAFFRFEVNDPQLLKFVMDHADPGIATDLASIKNVDNTWYCLISCFKSTAEISAAAAWVEANEKLFPVATMNTDIITTVPNGATDIAATLKAAAYARTGAIYHHKNGEFCDAALAGRVLPLQPGTETWHLKTLAGVTATALTPTHVTNLQGKNCNFYYNVAGVNVLFGGWVADKEFFDAIRGRDWLKSIIMQDLFTLLNQAPNGKVPYTDEGAAQVQSVILADLQRAVDVGYLAKTPKPTCFVPLISTVSSVDRGNRLLPSVQFAGQVAGAIHTINIAGQLSV